MTTQDFIPKAYSSSKESGSFTWSAPSNIALVKYWGKREPQIPQNPSISFTLDTCRTTTTLTYIKQKKRQDECSFDIYMDKQKNDAFKPKIEIFFKRVDAYLPFLKDYHFTIETSNSFPHSSGIASSASGMSALALCLMSIESALNPEMTQEYFNHKASFISRLGSGSACRSIEGEIVVWGKHKAITGSSDLFGIKYPYKVHDNFKNYQDTILLVDKGEKQISSTVGHNLMFDHPYAKERFRQANDNLGRMKDILESGNLKDFVKLVESEALSLHAMMLTSSPYFILMKPNTLESIKSIWKFRTETKTNLCFTLDAGANVHVLYPDKESEQVFGFIKNELAVFCENGHFISDRMGSGAKLINNE